ncbi:MAG: PAS domain S-box protein [Candidatus Omnitrophica bacterium]|nr:PAS domain S-box protein [Candidatus Omnitrophota bacterium]
MQYKIAIAILVSLAIAISIGVGLGSFWVTGLFRNTLGMERARTAELLSESIDRVINEEILDLEAYLSVRAIKDEIKKSNLEYVNMGKEAMAEYFKQKDARWAKASNDDPQIKRYLDNDASNFLKIVNKIDTGISEIFVTDKYGGIVAASGKTSDFYQADENWWQRAFNSGKGSVFIEDITYDESSNAWSMAIVIPVKDDDGTVLGICKDVLGIKRVLSPLEDIGVSKNQGNVFLLDRNGIIIYRENVKPLSETLVGQADFKKILKKKNYWMIADGQIKQKEKIFIGWAKVTEPHLLQNNIEWIVGVDNNIEEAFALLRKIGIQLIVILFLMLIVIAAVAFIFSRVLVSPIKKLHEATDRVAGGDLNYKVEINTGDEIEQLADSFNSMLEGLKRSTTSIDNLNREINERKRIEARLRDSEERLRVTLGSIGDGVIATDAKGYVVFINGVAQDLTGYTKEEAAGRHLREIFKIVNETTGKEVSNPAEKALSQGIIAKLSNHTILISKNGDRRSIDDSAAPIKDEKENIIGAVLVFRDVTERRRKEEVTQQLAAIVESSDDAIVGKTLDGIIISWNKAAEEIYGYSEDEVKGRHISMLAPPEHQDETMGLIDKIREGARVEHLETVRMRKDGVRINVALTVSPVYDANGNVVGASAIARDITERKRMEEKLASTAKEWEATFNSITDCVSIQGKDSRLIKVNKAYADLFKSTPEALCGKLCYSTVHETNEPCLNCPHQNTMKTKKPSRLEYFEERFNAYFEVSTSPIFDENGEVMGSVHIIKDITERKKVEQELARAAELKSHFTSMVSHELRTPLTAIKESISIVMDGTAGSLNDDQKNFLEMSRRNVDRLARLINDVLDYQKLESGKFEFHFLENDINEVIREVEKIMVSVAKDKGLDIVLKLEEDLPKIQCDRDKIVQVLANLINNAIKFTEKGGITISSAKLDNIVEIKVEDTGIGIKKEDLPRLFKAFEQLEAGKDRKTGSTGLGLAISKEIIERHKGEIWAESEIGRGSVFHFTLPVKERRY